MFTAWHIHSLSFCLKDVTNTFEVISDALNFIYELTQLTKMLPKRLTLFKYHTDELTSCLRMLCLTCWTVRHASIASILRNYSIIQSSNATIWHFSMLYVCHECLCHDMNVCHDMKLYLTKDEKIKI